LLEWKTTYNPIAEVTAFISHQAS